MKPSFAIESPLFHATHIVENILQAADCHIRLFADRSPTPVTGVSQDALPVSVS